jgi:hypothetical protein
MVALRRSAPFAAFVFVAFLWVNQGIGAGDWDAFKVRVVETHTASVGERLWYPLAFLYRRSLDEAIYWSTSGVILGRPYDAAVLDRGAAPEAFARALPPPDGHWHMPYTEVPFEYPPPALVVTVPLRLVAESFRAFGYAFGALMAVCLAAGVWFALRMARSSPARHVVGDRRWWAASLLVLAHGGIVVQRLDALLAVLLAGAAWAAFARRPTALGVFLGLAAATKFLPALFFPVVIAADRTYFREPQRIARVALVAFVTGALAIAPMCLGGGFLDVLRFHGQRGLHVESLLGSLYGAAMALAGARQVATHDFGSMNFHGPGSAILAQLATPLMLAGVAYVTFVTARASQGDEPRDRATRVACAMLALATVLWLTGKVFSPQYMTWGIPLALAIPGPRARRPLALLFAALLLSQVYLRGYYDHVFEQRVAGVVTLLVRQGVLVALFVTLVGELRSPRVEAMGALREAA